MRLDHAPVALLLVLACAAGPGLCAPTTLAAQGGTWTTDRSTAYDFDLGPSPDDASRFRLFFDVKHEFQQTRANPQGNHYGFMLSATGFQDFGQDTGGPDHMAFSGRLLGRYYRSSTPTLPAQQQLRYLDLLDRDPGSLSPAETDELRELFDRVRNGRRFVSYDLHYEIETDQDIARKQHSAGAMATVELPVLHGLLDILPAATRVRRTNYTAQPVRLLLAGDWVFARDVAGEAADSGFARLRGQAAWSTVVFDELVLRTTWVAEYMISPPAALEAATDDFNSFVQVWMAVPLNDRISVMIKYADGRLPPTYDLSSSTEVGFSIGLQ